MILPINVMLKTITKKKTLIDTENRLMVARGAEGGEDQMSEKAGEGGIVKCMVMDV